MKTITIEELLQLDQDTITVLDVRPADAYTRGSVPGAVSIPLAEVEERMEELPKEKPVYVLCHTGEWSVDAVYELEAAGYDAANIEGGYRSFLRKKLSEFVQDENTTGEKQKEIERSIIKKFRKGIWRKFTKGIREYDLIQDGDKIAVCISGGKDSMLMAKLFQELLKHGKANFELVFLVMNPGYNEDNWKIIQDNAKVLGIPLTVFETQIFDTVADIDKNPCYLCARMRRGYLYSHAKELGCNKIALGHHFDDVIETILMGMLYGAQVQTAEVTGQEGWRYLAAALSTGLSCIGAGIAVASAGSAAIGALSEDASVMGKALIFVALAESIALYGLLISFSILG